MVFLVLVRRDLIMIRKRLRGLFITGIIQLAVAVILFGKLFPTMGIPAEMIAPLYLGSMCAQMLFLGNTMGFRNVYDIKYHRVIDYHITLPIPKRWLFASSIVYFVIESLIITLPLMTLGIIWLAPQFHMAQPNFIAFALVYLISLIFFGLMFLALSFYYEPNWFMENLWPRRISILLGLSPIFFLWKKVYAFSPKVALSMLISPLTYPVEGLRSTLLGSDNYIAWYLCIPAIIFFSYLATILLTVGVKKRLDPV